MKRYLLWQARLLRDPQVGIGLWVTASLLALKLLG